MILPPPPESLRDLKKQLVLKDAAAWIAENKPFILDVRPLHFFMQGHLPQAVNIPLFALQSRLNELPKNQSILTVCSHGNSSYSAMEFLLKNDFKKVLSLKSGVDGWKEAGFSVEH